MARELNALRDARLAVGVSQATLAAWVGTSQQVVSRWENGRLEPTVPLSNALAVALDCPPSLLIKALAGPGRRRSLRGPRPGSDALGRELRVARIAARLERVDVARASGLSARRIARIEDGADPSLAEFVAVASACGETLDELIERAGLDRIAGSPTPLVSQPSQDDEAHPVDPMSEEKHPRV